jgi:hypothetical protein
MFHKTCARTAPAGRAPDVMADGMLDQVAKPTEEISVRDVFGIDTDMKVKGFADRTDRVPEIDPTYKFDPDTTLAILAGFAYNRRVMIQGYHGTGKSTHIEQVAARLNWPCVRVNLDSHISRIDLIGKDAIKLEDGKQVTEFHEGILPWALRNPVAIVFDEYDAGRADVMFVIQRVLEHDGKLTLLDQNEIITPHPSFRLFAIVFRYVDGFQILQRDINRLSCKIVIGNYAQLLRKAESYFVVHFLIRSEADVEYLFVFIQGTREHFGHGSLLLFQVGEHNLQLLPIFGHVVCQSAYQGIFTFTNVINLFGNQLRHFSRRTCHQNLFGQKITWIYLLFLI